MRRLVHLLALACAAVLLAGRATSQNFLASAQEEDGRWSAARFGGKPEADLRVNAWIVLAHLGDGSTLRAGPCKAQVKGGVRWLTRQQDEQGRLGLRADPDWLLDHAMAAFALAEAARLSKYKLLRPRAEAAADALARELGRARPAPSAEVHLWARAIVLSLRGDGTDEAKAAAGRLAGVLDGAAVRLPRTARERAAQEVLEDVLRDRPVEHEALPACCPDDLAADAMTTFYALWTAWIRGGESWRKMARRVNEGVVKTQASDPGRMDIYGSWDPAGAFGEENGRLGQTAVNVLVLQLFYRYSKLSLVPPAAEPARERSGR